MKRVRNRSFHHAATRAPRLMAIALIMPLLAACETLSRANYQPPQEDKVLGALLETYKEQGRALLAMQKHFIMEGRRSVCEAGESACELDDQSKALESQSKKMRTMQDDLALDIEKKKLSLAEKNDRAKNGKDAKMKAGDKGATAKGEKMDGKKKVWKVREGDTLYGVLNKWSNESQWKIIWRAAYEYPIQADASFTGDFPLAVKQILLALKNNHPPVHATFYKNRVAVIENHESDY